MLLFAFLDYPEDAEQRIIGALGGIYSRAHGGKICVTDVTSSVLSVLVDVYQHIVVEDEEEVRVNFHFDYESDLLRLRCLRQREAQLTIDAKINKDLVLRVPCWAPRDSIELRADGRPAPLVWEGSFLRVDKQFLPQVHLTYDLPIQKQVEKASGMEFEITWRGDEIIGVCPNTGFYPFFPTASDCGQAELE